MAGGSYIVYVNCEKEHVQNLIKVQCMHILHHQRGLLCAPFKLMSCEQGFHIISLPLLA